MQNNDIDIDIFLVFEEVASVEGKMPPTTRKDLTEFLHDKRKAFVKCYHVIAVNPTAQVYLVRDLHNTVHGGLLRPGIKPFLQAISRLQIPHVYYGASVPNHSNDFLRICNGRAVMKLKSYPLLDFDIAMSRVNKTIVGKHWNSQYTWGFSSMNIKRMDPGDLVNKPTIKSSNVTDGILPQFLALSELLLEINKNNDFYCGLLKGDQQQRLHAQLLMEEDPLMPPSLQKKNIIESVLGICNVYTKSSTVDMYTGAHDAHFIPDHQSNNPSSS
jgi:hypothetical protein